jgi:membrane-associated phospholipid phosphatase
LTFPKSVKRETVFFVPPSLTTPASLGRTYEGLAQSRGRQALSAVPVLDREPGLLGRRLAYLPGSGRAVPVYLLGVSLSWAVIAGASILLGLLVTKVLLAGHGIGRPDERPVDFLVRHRSEWPTEASLVGSTAAGGVVLPAVAAVYALALAAFRHWRLAAFIPFTLALESASYRATTLVVHRDRPPVPRLEHLPVDASYPSGHTAASIAVYGGLALIATSRFTHRPTQVFIWAAAVLILAYVASSRMYRGMHHPIDIAGGVVIGVAVLTAMVVVSRSARVAALDRNER